MGLAYTKIDDAVNCLAIVVGVIVETAHEITAIEFFPQISSVGKLKERKHGSECRRKQPFALVSVIFSGKSSLVDNFLGKTGKVFRIVNIKFEIVCLCKKVAAEFQEE